MFWFIQKVFIRLLTSTANASNHSKCVSLNNQQCITQSALVNLCLTKHSQGLHYYPFVFDLVRSVRGCNTLDDLSN